MRDRTILDVGAWIGDSLLILTKLTNYNVISFEISKKSADHYTSNANFN